MRIVVDSFFALAVAAAAIYLLHPLDVAIAVGLCVPFWYWLGVLVGRRTR